MGKRMNTQSQQNNGRMNVYENNEKLFEKRRQSKANISSLILTTKKLGGGKILEKLRMNYLLFTPSITLPINSAYIS